MICKKAIKIAMGVGMVLCATASFAARTESFEAALDGNIWSGDITDALVSVNPGYNEGVGYPLPDVEHTKVLNVEGEVICANTATTTETSVSDFLVYIPELSDELEADGLDNAKIAVAAGTALTTNNKIPLMLFCKPGSTGITNWVQIAEVDSNTWYRVTLVFKDSRCRVSLDGEPVKNASGYTASTGDTTGGAWYNLASSPSNLGIGSLSFIGCAKLDDVVINDAYAEDAAFLDTAVATVEGESVSYNNLNKWNMTASDLSSNWNNVLNQTSGMTVGQKIACGYDPNSATKFVPVSITKEDANQATIKFPIESTAELGRYSVEVDGGTADGTGTATAADESGFAQFNLSNITYTGESKVIKFTLKATSPSSGSGAGN